MLDQVLSVYVTGLGYTLIGSVIIGLSFAIYRWYKCVQQYIETGNIDSSDDSWVLMENNWFHGSRSQYDFGTNPWVAAADIVTVTVMAGILSLAWPVTIITTTVITYARIARVRFARKKEFMDRLQGEHVEVV